MDACPNNACENGATCKVTEEDSYSCQCPNGFFGDKCEKGTTEKNGEEARVQLYPLFKFYFPLFQSHNISIIISKLGGFSYIQETGKIKFKPGADKVSHNSYRTVQLE